MLVVCAFCFYRRCSKRSEAKPSAVDSPPPPKLVPLGARPEEEATVLSVAPEAEEEPVQSPEGWGARGLQRLASWRAPAAAPPPITLGGKKVDVAQEELCSPRRVDMVHASVERWYNTTGKGAALRTRFGPFPATPEALNKWYARNKVMTAFLDDQGVPPEF